MIACKYPLLKKVEQKRALVGRISSNLNEQQIVFLLYIYVDIFKNLVNSEPTAETVRVGSVLLQMQKLRHESHIQCPC